MEQISITGLQYRANSFLSRSGYRGFSYLQLAIRFVIDHLVSCRATYEAIVHLYTIFLATTDRKSVLVLFAREKWSPYFYSSNCPRFLYHFNCFRSGRARKLLFPTLKALCKWNEILWSRYTVISAPKRQFQHQIQPTNSFSPLFT